MLAFSEKRRESKEALQKLLEKRLSIYPAISMIPLPCIFIDILASSDVIKITFSICLLFYVILILLLVFQIVLKEFERWNTSK